MAETKASATVSTAAIARANLHYGASLAFVTTPQAVANADLAPAATFAAVTSGSVIRECDRWRSLRQRQFRPG
jgi:hypothetical protein